MKNKIFMSAFACCMIVTLDASPKGRNATKKKPQFDEHSNTACNIPAAMTKQQVLDAMAQKKEVYYENIPENFSTPTGRVVPVFSAGNK